MSSSRDLLVKLIEMSSEVYNILGPGHRESVYHSALEVELRTHNIPYDSEKNVEVLYKGYSVGIKRLDLVIYDNFSIDKNMKIAIELKAMMKKPSIQEYKQLHHYLLNLNIEKGLLLNFPQPNEKTVDYKIDYGIITNETIINKALTDEFISTTP